METSEKLVEFLATYSCGINYKPTKTEVSPLEIFPELSAKILYTIQPIASLIPADEAKITQELVNGQSAFILIPGREFDATGTRHGKGAGWYDRFLSAVPREWLRIGFCYDDQFSRTPLIRKSWDEPMDFVCVIERGTNKILCYDARMQKISLIAAIGAENRALGKNNQLLWQIPDDMRRFKKITTGHPVIMGRKTWESIPEKFRPLPDRVNIVVTRQKEFIATGAEVCGSLEEAIQKAKQEIESRSDLFADRSDSVSNPLPAEIFIIGGGELYKEALPLADKLYLTLIDEEKAGDVFFPEYEQIFTKKVFEETHDYNGLTYTWVDLERA